jgi:hypothetical protein
VTDAPASPASLASQPPLSGADCAAADDGMPVASSEARIPEEVRIPDAGDGPVLPEVSRDDLDEGWGDDPRDGRRDAQWYQRERPPHHE